MSLVAPSGSRPLPGSPSPKRGRDGVLRAWRMAVLVWMGFASGLPLALTGQSMQAWLSLEGLDVATIGFLSLVGLPYTFKFLWAPLMDRFDLPWLGRRRGWMVASQLALGGVLLVMAATPPKTALQAFALLAVAVAFLSATQDVVIDAYTTDLLPGGERGLGSSLKVLGYRLAMILSGGVALIWTDPANALVGDAGSAAPWTWPEVYRLMALLLAVSALLGTVALPRLPELRPEESAPGVSMRQDLVGFLAVVAAVVSGYVITDRVLAPLAGWGLTPLLEGSSLSPLLRQRWVDLAALLAGIALTLPLAAWAARRARFQTLLGGLASYFAQPGAWAFLGFVVLYKLGDAFAGSLMTPFLLKSMAFGSAEVGVVNKLIGLWLTIAGAVLGGALMLRLGLWRSLLLFGVLQAASNLGFWWLAMHGKGALPGWVVPAFDWGFLHLAQPTPVDGGLLMVIAFENLSGGMGTAAFVAFLMSLTSRRFSATQYALLSAFASVGRVWVGPLAGVLAESIGWPTFFIVSTVLALPALGMLWALRAQVRALEPEPATASSG
ncbi:MAG: MFS transporter [Burkholderiales bacterium]|nr:MFS transporter [Burkholderiales bacterium]